MEGTESRRLERGLFPVPRCLAKLGGGGKGCSLTSCLPSSPSFSAITEKQWGKQYMQTGRTVPDRTIAGPVGASRWGRLTRLAPLREVFGVDLRTLALFRVLLASYLILDLCLRARDLTAHYTDFGIMPRSVLAESLSTGSWSFHALSGSASLQVFLFVVAGAFAAMMLVGWRTRLATLVSWVLLVSLQNRNVFILSGEDNLAIVLLFWAMFLPLGARYSIDCALDTKTGRTPMPSFQSRRWRC